MLLPIFGAKCSVPTFSSWNVEGRLSLVSPKGRGSTKHILHELAVLGSDVIFLVESHARDSKPATTVETKLKKWGYSITDVAYEEGIERTPLIPSPNMRLLSKLPIRSIKINRLGNLRNSIEAEIKDPITGRTIRFLGIHLDDRSEDLRRIQLNDLIPIINSSKLPTILMGDYNSMHGSTRRAKFLKSRFVWVLKHMVPSKSLRSFVDRAIDMATGSILASLQAETELKDVDVHRRATTTPKLRQHPWLPSVRLIDIDHALVSDDIAIEQFSIGKHDSGSDHRPITITFSL
jgi:endonuclease/exonuclease/phosphatase family metal-dependent hydrolase